MQSKLLDNKKKFVLSFRVNLDEIEQLESGEQVTIYIKGMGFNIKRSNGDENER